MPKPGEDTKKVSPDSDSGERHVATAAPWVLCLSFSEEALEDFGAVQSRDQCPGRPQFQHLDFRLRSEASRANCFLMFEAWVNLRLRCNLVISALFSFQVAARISAASFSSKRAVEKVSGLLTDAVIGQKRLDVGQHVVRGLSIIGVGLKLQDHWIFLYHIGC